MKSQMANILRCTILPWSLSALSTQNILTKINTLALTITGNAPRRADPSIARDADHEKRTVKPSISAAVVTRLTTAVLNCTPMKSQE